MSHESMKEVQTPEEIPQFSSEAEEAEFWATHSLGYWFFEAADPVSENILPSVRPSTSPLSELLDDSTLSRLKELAYRRKVDSRTLLNQLIAERLDEEEEREGTPAAGQAEGAERDRTSAKSAEQQKAARQRNWQDEAFKFVRDHEELLQDEDLDFLTSANLLEESTTLLLKISNEIGRTSAMKGSRSNKMRRLIKGYDELKGFCDRAFAVHEQKFGLPQRSEAEDTREPEEPKESAEDRKLKELLEERRSADNNVIDARERFAM